MHLSRITPTWGEDETGKFVGTISDDFRAGRSDFLGDMGTWIVRAFFLRFGAGKNRQSDFAVEVRWVDVEKIIEQFCAVEHPEAIALRDAVKLATAAKELGWRAPETALPQSN